MAGEASSASIFVPPAVAASVLVAAPTPPAGITSFDELSAWADTADIKDRIVAALGGTVSLRDIAFTTEDDWESWLSTVQITEGEGTRPLVLLERARVRALRSGARTALNLVFPTAATQSAAAPSGSTGPATKKIKLSQLVDATAETELVDLDPITLRNMFDHYVQARGEPPSVDVEPTAEQLSAIHQLVGGGAAPYVDFSLFGPHGRRLLKRLSFFQQTFSPITGGWTRQELPGPPSFEAWLKCWRVLECSLLLLQAVRPERLRNYEDKIRGFNAQYGETVWPIIYQADVRCRSEEFERLRRYAEIAQSKIPAGSISAGGPSVSEFDSKLPWDGVFAIAVRHAEFWTREVKDKALLHLAHIAPKESLLSDHTVIELHSAGARSSAQAPPQPSRNHKQKNKRGQRVAEKSAQRSFQQAPVPQANRSSSPCRLFADGKCETPCKYGRVHVSKHPGAPAPGKKAGKGKGK